MKQVILVLSLVISTQLWASSNEAPVKMVRVGDGKISYVTAGAGDITVIFESGSDGKMESWSPILDNISLHARVFTYNRPGIGDSDSTSRPRTSKQIIDDLRNLLAKAEIRGPYVLVGHSSGGSYMLDFAHFYPEDVSALVLIDGAQPDFHRIAVERGLMIIPESPEERYKGWPDHSRREFEAVLSMELSGGIGDIPLLVITGGKGRHQTEIGALWLKTQQELVRLSSNSRHIVDEKSGHMIHYENPDLVIESVLDILKQIQAREP